MAKWLFQSQLHGRIRSWLVPNKQQQEEKKRAIEALQTFRHLYLCISCLQIDIGPELASRIIHKAQAFSSGKKIPREQKEPGLFDEAQSILFKEMLSYWAGFCKQYTPPEDGANVKLPPTKQEKLLQKRYAEFLKYPAVTKTLTLPLLVPSVHGQSKSELSFSVADGMKWKETKDLETASVASSQAGSTRGRAGENGATMDISNQQTQVEVNT